MRYEGCWRKVIMATIEQILNECVERLRKGATVEQCLASFPEQASELEPLLKAVVSLNQFSALRPRAEFKAQVRTQALMALRRKTARKQHSWLGGFMWRRTWATVAVGILALVAVGGGAVAASANTLPGHPLYAVKTTVERAQLALTASDVGKAKLLVKFADKRVQEIGSVVKEGRGDEVDELSIAMVRDLERLKETIRGPISPDRAISDASKAVTAATTAQSAVLQPSPDTITPVPPPSSGVGVLAGPSAEGQKAEAHNGDEKDQGDVSEARDVAEVRQRLSAEAQKQLRYLEELLEEADEKDQPAIRRAIERAASAYEQAAKEGD